MKNRHTKIAVLSDIQRLNKIETLLKKVEAEEVKEILNEWKEELYKFYND